jgi:hypothetical protein
MRLGLTAGSTGLLAACGWDGGSALQPALGAASRLNDWVGEHLIHSNARLAREYPAALRTGSAFPAYFVSRRMPVLADPGAWGLEVSVRSIRPWSQEWRADSGGGPGDPGCGAAGSGYLSGFRA